MDDLNVGIVGCGRISDLHAAAYKTGLGARIYAVCDLDTELLEARRRAWGAEKAYRDFEALLADERLDAVEILTPHTAHERMCLQALQAGKHAAVQKPMTIDLASADRMVAAAARSSTLLKVTDNYLFYPPLVLARKMIDEGEIGEPLGLHMKYIGGGSGGWDTEARTWQWRVQERMDGRPIITFDHGHHLLATAWFLFGEVERVTAWIDTLDGVVDTPAVAMWKHRHGKRYGVSDAVHAPDMHVPSKYYANDEWYEISGTRGIVLVRRCTGNVQEGAPVSLFDGHRWHHYDVESDWAAGFAGAARNFVEAVHGRTDALLSAEQGREILRFSLALQRSASQRREVFLDEMDGRLGRLGAWLRRRHERRQAGRQNASFGGLSRTSRYAPLAWQLTQEAVARIDQRAAREIDFEVGLDLSEDAGVEERLGFASIDGRIEVTRGLLPEAAAVTLTMPAGVWAAILAKKLRLETALLRGQIRLEGKAELALKLRKLLGV